MDRYAHLLLCCVHAILLTLYMRMRIDTTKLLVGVGFVCVVAAAGVWVAREWGGDAAAVSDAALRPSPTVVVQLAAEGGASPTPTAAAVRRPTPTPKLAYDAAVREYEGRRIQLDTECSAIPSRATYKNGTTLMLDNRSGQARTVLFNLVQYTIPAYDYLVVSAVASTTPAVTYLDCGQKQNVAQITIQQ